MLKRILASLLLVAGLTVGITLATAVPAVAACNDVASKTTSKTVNVADDDGTMTWVFSVKVWYQRCPIATDIRSLTYKYTVDHSADPSNSPCTSWNGVDEIRMNSGNIGGWNPPYVAFVCQNNDLADAKNFDAPASAAVNCSNDNETGAAVTVWRDSAFFGDSHYDVPLMSIPRPLNC